MIISLLKKIMELGSKMLDNSRKVIEENDKDISNISLFNCIW